MTQRRTVTRVPVIDALDPQDRYDYILLVVRANQIPDLLPDVARNVSPTVVFMGNNLSSTGTYTAALGQDRVLLGFVFGAGKRDGDLVRAWAPQGLMAKTLVAPFGEVDGTFTPRLYQLVALFRRAGLQAKASPVMGEYLTTHAAQVAVVAALILKHGCDTTALARSTADMRLLVDGLCESLEVLRATGHRIVPWSTAAMRYVPRVVLVGIYRLLFASKMGEVGAGWHCAQAPDEMAYLAASLNALVERSGCAVPELRRILAMNQQERPRVSQHA
jgi:2-dehydropantoate 2-reductase